MGMKANTFGISGGAPDAVLALYIIPEGENLLLQRRISTFCHSLLSIWSGLVSAVRLGLDSWDLTYSWQASFI